MCLLVYACVSTYMYSVHGLHFVRIQLKYLRYLGMLFDLHVLCHFGLPCVQIECACKELKSGRSLQVYVHVYVMIQYSTDVFWLAWCGCV